VEKHAEKMKYTSTVNNTFNAFLLPHPLVDRLYAPPPQGKILDPPLFRYPYFCLGIHISATVLLEVCLIFISSSVHKN